MIDRNALEATVKKIEQHPNQLRIKKLLFCARQNAWENNRSKLEALDTHHLVQQLYEAFPTLEILKSKFIDVVKKINKKSLYFSLALQAFKFLRNLYPEKYKDLNKVHLYLQKNHQKIKYQNLFNLHFLVDLKFTVSRTTSLTQAKILIYSALYYKFNYAVQDWNSMNHQEFDDLVRLFFHDCETLENIEFRLEGAAHYIEETQNNIQVARTIIRSIRNFYSHVWQQEEKKICSKTIIYEPTKIQDRENNIEEDNTISEPEYCSISSQYPVNFQQNIGFESSLLMPEIEQKAREISRQKLNNLMSQLENSLKDLDSYLERNFLDPKSEEYLIVKQRILRDFVQDFQLASTQYLGLIQTLEQNELKKRFPSSFLNREP